MAHLQTAQTYMQAAPMDPQVAALKLPPHSIEAEQSLIGGLLLDNSAWDRIADIVSESDFYRDDHRRIFAHIRKLVETGRPADVVTVYESIEHANQAEQTADQVGRVETRPIRHGPHQEDDHGPAAELKPHVEPVGGAPHSLGMVLHKGHHDRQGGEDR